MASDGRVVFSTELDQSGLQKCLLGLNGSIGKWAKGLAGAFTFAKLVDGLANVTVAAVKYNAKMESYAANFGVMLQDEAKGLEYVAKLREKAAKTPFGMDDLAGAAQTMLGFGLSADKTSEAMDRLGDIALGDKAKFQSLSLAFSQISAAGKLMGQDLLQMVNAGFNPLNTLAEKTGTNLGDLKDVMSGGKGSKDFRKQMKAAQKEVKKLGDGASEGAKLLAQIGMEGGISAEMVGKAMEIETSPGGRFYNGMEKASESVNGQFSTLKDNAMQLAGNIFSPLSDMLGNTLLPIANGVVNALNGMFEDRSFTIEAQAEIDQAKTDLDTLDADVQALKEKYLKDQIAVNLTVANASELAAEIEGMFEITPKLKDWDDGAKDDAIEILGKLNDMIPGFKYTPDEAGLERLRKDLDKESKAVSNTVEEYGKLEKARNASALVSSLQGEVDEAEVNAAYLATQKQDLVAQKAEADRRLKAYSYLYEQSAVNNPNGLADRLGMAGSAADTGAIAGALDLLDAFSMLGGNLSELEERRPEDIDLTKLVDAAGNLKDAETLAGDGEAIMSLYNALVSLNEVTEDKSGGELEKSEVLAKEIEAIEQTLATKMQEIEAARKELETAQSLYDQLESGKTVEEVIAEAETSAKTATEKPYTFALDADDQASDVIGDVDTALNALDGKKATVSLYISAIMGYGENGDLPDVDGSHAGGLSRVPFDGYLARLHEGEAVLTKAEASLWRAGRPTETGGSGGASAAGSGGASAAGSGGFQQVNNFNIPVSTPDEFANTMKLYATYGLEGVI